MSCTVGCVVGSGVIFRKDAGSVVGGEKEDSIYGEEGHVRSHVCRFKEV